MFSPGFVRSLVLLLLFSLTQTAVSSVTRKDLEKVRAEVLRLVEMSKNQSLSDSDRKTVQTALADAITRSRANLQAAYDMSRGLISACPTDNLAESAVIVLYGGWRDRALSTFTAPLYMLIGHCDPLVRLVATQWLHDHFSGDQVESSLFPMQSTPITSRWIEDLSSHTQSNRPTAIAKALARLAYNAEFDADPDARRIAKVTWSLIENLLIQARSSDPAMRRRVARLWLNDIQDIQGYWARQRTKLRSLHDGLVMPGESKTASENPESVSDILDRAQYGDHNQPPLPPCQDLLIVKKMLN